MLGVRRDFVRDAGRVALFLASIVAYSSPSWSADVATIGDEVLTDYDVVSRQSQTVRDAASFLFVDEVENTEALIVDKIMAIEARAAHQDVEAYRAALVDKELSSVPLVDVVRRVARDELELERVTQAQLDEARQRLAEERVVEGYSQRMPALVLQYRVVWQPHPPALLMHNRVAADPRLGIPVGPANAPITLTVYSALECDVCRAISARLAILRSEYGERVRVVFRHYVDIDQREAFKAAVIGQCLSEQGDYWTYQQRLFAARDLREDQVLLVASELAKEKKVLRDCINSKRAEREVRFDTDEANSFDVNAPVIVLINGIKTAGAQSLSFYRAIIDEELRLIAQGEGREGASRSGAGAVARESF